MDEFVGHWKLRIQDIIQFPNINPEIVCRKASPISLQCFLGGGNVARITWNGTRLVRCDLYYETGNYNGQGIINWDRGSDLGYSLQWIRRGN